MPKKGKKGKGKGKKGKKSGKKGGKRGKSGKPKVDRDSELTMAVANAKLWASRLEVTEVSRNEYRESCKKLAVDNEKLHDTLFQSEKDTIDVITYMKKGELDKDDKIQELEHQLREFKKESRQEKEKFMAEFNASAAELENKLHQRTSEVKLMQSELKMVKEFRRKRAQMQSELDEIREGLYLANTEHKDTLQKMEHKFFEEKIRLEREASQKIAELAERAHTEAIANLDETTRSVYKENVRLNEALSYHIKESQDLRTERDKLQREVEELRAHKELNDATVKEKVTESKQNKQLIANLKEKVENLEKALSKMVHEFHSEKRILEEKFRVETAVTRTDVHRLERTLSLKEREMNKVKFVAKSILDQRTSVEVFFLDALEQVRTEIALNRAQYVQAAKSAYQRKMMAAHAGQGSYPKIRTFQKSDSSTNSVYADLSEAENWASLGNKIDIRELTWEQKEKVLRLLFAKMNGIANLKKKEQQKALPHPPSAPAQLSLTNKPSDEDKAPEAPAFLTQSEEIQQQQVTSIPDHNTSGVSLPDIGKPKAIVTS
ncbi:basal body-orientation factor 1-like [Styela clava]